MRRNVVVIVLLTVLGLMVILALSSKRAGSQSGTAVSKNEEGLSNSVAQVAATNVAIAAVENPPGPVSATNHADYVRQRRDELMELAMHNDAASLETILSELQNPDRQIRKAALEATVQFSDRAAVPRLRDLASRTTDEEEKADIEAAADYLALPSVTEVMAQQQAQRQAMGLTNPPVRDTNRLARRGTATRRPVPSMQAH